MLPCTVEVYVRVHRDSAVGFVQRWHAETPLFNAPRPQRTDACLVVDGRRFYVSKAVRSLWPTPN